MNMIAKVIRVNGVNAIVEIVRYVLNKKYNVKLKKTSKFMVQDNLGVKIGNIVELVSCIPVSKRKRLEIKCVKSEGKGEV